MTSGSHYELLLAFRAFVRVKKLLSKGAISAPHTFHCESQRGAAVKRTYWTLRVRPMILRLVSLVAKEFTKTLKILHICVVAWIMQNCKATSYLPVLCNAFCKALSNTQTSITNWLWC